MLCAWGRGLAELESCQVRFREANAPFQGRSYLSAGAGGHTLNWPWSLVIISEWGRALSAGPGHPRPLSEGPTLCGEDSCRVPRRTLLQSAQRPKAVLSSSLPVLFTKGPHTISHPKCLHSLYSVAGRPGLTLHPCNVVGTGACPSPSYFPIPSAFFFFASTPSWVSLIHQVEFSPLFCSHP